MVTFAIKKYYVNKLRKHLFFNSIPIRKNIPERLLGILQNNPEQAAMQNYTLGILPFSSVVNDMVDFVF